MTKHNQTIGQRMEGGSIPEPNSGCWLWLGSPNRYGYSVITVNGQCGTKVHRASYEFYKGAIPKGMHVCHRCDTRLCVNPDHLFLGTNDDNVADKVRKNRQAKGEQFSHAVLTEELVRKIRADSGSTRYLAKKYGVGKSQVHLVTSGQAWRHVT